jgi:hypothetical protein
MERRVDKICANCGEVFFKDPRNTWVYWERAKYCGRRCAAEGWRKKSVT